MASPKLEIFALFDAGTGLPLTGAVPTFDTYKDTTGANISQPAITEVGGGFYKFQIVFADPAKGVMYIVNGGVSAASRVWRYARPEDWADDDVTAVRKIQTNRWKIAANQLTVYDDDGTTVFKVFNLKDDTGAPTMSKIFERVP